MIPEVLSTLNRSVIPLVLLSPWFQLCARPKSCQTRLCSIHDSFVSQKPHWGLRSSPWKLFHQH